MSMQVVGVIGAGVMGSGVAQNLAQTGHHVLLLDLSETILEKAKQEIQNNLRFQGFFKRETPSDNPEDVLARIKFTTDISVLREAEFAIENIVEKWTIKREVYTQIDAICPPSIIFAANTSAISITQIASATKRAPQVIGTHFMNPVPMKSMVEVIRGDRTSDETIAATKMLLTQMGKDCIVVNDAPGFVSNRVLMLTINEAIFLLQDRVASVEDVDRIFKTCFGHKMGPLETADLIGLDTILLSVEVLYESFNDSKYRPCPLLKQMVYAGKYGRKSGQGFYTYK
ncbi:3-hydroxyacyl-CoA dehydrogenase family protein [Chroococcidiopsis sp. CCNUC1]|uniref:3-hydroxyacyl-CoA dehydrogenase family protein n=1 Tax=Chroococcidiopsis sp. CCNUC1 TaxID=2653189 RepID=UPI00273A5C36|nr:3-hydroxyacyl-CoA dehydrogenase NAD-binding domain-containing protein [Chroococcidiopsis sp. CCNUC1]